MRLIGKSALLLTCLALIEFHLAAQTAPCTAKEPPPTAHESNPTTRDAAIIYSRATNPTVTAEVCLVTGTKNVLHPGPLPEYKPGSFGLYFDWNLAIIADDGRLDFIDGTILKTGALDLSPAGPDALAQPLALSWSLDPAQPKPSDHRVLAQVATWPCTDASATCSPDATKEFWVTRLLSASRAKSPKSSPVPHPYGPGCLAPMYPGEPDPHLRQFTVEAFDNQYAVYACLVSNHYESFQVASFNVDLKAADGTSLVVSPNGNTRLNIGKLYRADTDTTPNLVALLGVQMQSVAAVAPKVDSADITLTYVGCTDDHEANCDAQVVKRFMQKPEQRPHNK